MAEKKVGFAVDEKEEAAKEAAREAKKHDPQHDGGYTDLQKTLKRNKKLREEKMAAQRAAQEAEKAADAAKAEDPVSALKKAKDMAAAAELLKNTGKTDKAPVNPVEVKGKFKKVVPEKEQNKIVIIGSSGYVGSATVELLAELAPLATEGKAGLTSIHLGVRNPRAVRASRLPVTPIINLVQAELKDVASLDAIMAGARVVVIIPPPTENRAALAKNGIAAAVNAKAKFLIVTSSTLVGVPGVGWMGDSFAEIEAAVLKCGLPSTIIRLGMFSENLWNDRFTIAGEGKLFGCLKPTTPIGCVSATDLGIAIGQVILSPMTHVGHSYSLTGPITTYSDVAKGFQDATKKPVVYEQIPFDTYQANMVEAGTPEFFAKAMVQAFKILDKVKEAPVMSPDYDSIVGKLTGAKNLHSTVQSFAAENATMFEKLPPRPTLPYSLLSGPKDDFPTELNYAKRYTYLSDADYATYLAGNTIASFAKLPAWKQKELLRVAKLL